MWAKLMSSESTSAFTTPHNPSSISLTSSPVCVCMYVSCICVHAQIACVSCVRVHVLCRCACVHVCVCTILYITEQQRLPSIAIVAYTRMRYGKRAFAYYSTTFALNAHSEPNSLKDQTTSLSEDPSPWQHRNGLLIERLLSLTCEGVLHKPAVCQVVECRLHCPHTLPPLETSKVEELRNTPFVG